MVLSSSPLNVSATATGTFATDPAMPSAPTTSRAGAAATVPSTPLLARPPGPSPIVAFSASDMVNMRAMSSNTSGD